MAERQCTGLENRRPQGLQGSNPCPSAPPPARDSHRVVSHADACSNVSLRSTANPCPSAPPRPVGILHPTGSPRFARNVSSPCDSTANPCPSAPPHRPGFLTLRVVRSFHSLNVSLRSTANPCPSAVVYLQRLTEFAYTPRQYRRLASRFVTRTEDWADVRKRGMPGTQRHSPSPLKVSNTSRSSAYTSSRLMPKNPRSTVRVLLYDCCLDTASSSFASNALLTAIPRRW